MRTSDLIARSIHIITAYYENDLEPFFENISDDVLWIGPSERQYIRGKDQLLETFARESHELTFSMGDIKAMCVAPDRHVREVVLHYDVFTYYPTGNIDRHDQRLHFTWRERRERDGEAARWVPKLVLVHISNAWPYDLRDTIYPVHYEAISSSLLRSAKPGSFVTLKSIDGTFYRISPDSIIFIETVKRSARLLVHTKDEDITVSGTLPAFEKSCPEFLRIHASYVINPASVREIRRFSVTLSNGATLPIPEKKYTRIKRQLLERDAPGE